MSKVSRSTFQKVCEENKRLKKDIKLLVSEDFDDEWVVCMKKWRDFFSASKKFMNYGNRRIQKIDKTRKKGLPKCNNYIEVGKS